MNLGNPIILLGLYLAEGGKAIENPGDAFYSGDFMLL